MAKRNKVNELSTDGFSRFYFLCLIIEQLYKSTNRQIKILDVGGGSEYMQQQLKSIDIDYELTVLDIIEKPKGIKVTYVQGDATKMGFDNDQFDLVISTDVFEHIPEKNKQAFLDECLRVAKEACIIAAPFETEGVTAAEIAVNNFNKKLFGVGQNWLVEHLELGKPTLKLVTDTLERDKIPYKDFGTQNITTWLLNTHLNLIEAKIGLNPTEHTRINKFYNNNILEMNEFQGPSYRHFFVMFTDPTKERAFKIDSFDSKTNPELMVKYIDDILILITDRLQGFIDERDELQKKFDELQVLVAGLSEANNQLNEANIQLSERLAKHEKYLRLVRPLHNITEELSNIKKDKNGGENGR